MKIEVIRAFCLAGQRQEVGSVVEVDDRFARELMHNHKAVEATEKPAAEKPADMPARRGRPPKEQTE